MSRMSERYERKQPIGFYAITAELGIVFFEPDEIDKMKNGCDIVAAYSDPFKGYSDFHIHNIFYTSSGRAFIRKHARRIYLEDVLKTNI